MRTYIKKSAVILLCLALALSLTACKNPKKGDYPAPLMIDGTNYYSTDNPVSVELEDQSVFSILTTKRNPHRFSAVGRNI